MIILGIDPSINETGWAVLQQGEELVQGPPFEHRLQLVAHGVWRPKAKDPYERLQSLCRQLVDTAEEHQITDLVIETTSGKLAGRLKGTNANMLLYGVVVGGLYMFAREARGVRVQLYNYWIHRVLENLWTGGVPKPKRNAATIAEFGLPKKTNHNAVDAIGLVAWWHANRNILKEMNACPNQQAKPRPAKKTRVKIHGKTRKRTTPPTRPKA